MQCPSHGLDSTCLWHAYCSNVLSNTPCLHLLTLARRAQVPQVDVGPQVVGSERQGAWNGVTAPLYDHHTLRNRTPPDTVPTNSITKLWSVNSVLQTTRECTGKCHEKTGTGTSGKKCRLHYRRLGTYLLARHVCLYVTWPIRDSLNRFLWNCVQRSFPKRFWCPSYVTFGEQ
jgi:hypothetical protein